MRSSSQLLEWDRLRTHLARACRSEPGRERALRLEPASDYARYRELRDQVRECRTWLAARPGPVAEAFQDPAPLLGRAAKSGSGLSSEELALLKAAVRSSEILRRTLGGSPEFLALRRFAADFHDLEALDQHLERILDARGEVLDTASPELAELRRQREREESAIRDLAHRLAGESRYRTVVRGGPPVLRDGRYMLAVKAESRGNVPGVLHDRSGSGNTVFVEPEELVEPQNALADLRAKERQIVGRILLEATRRVLREEAEIAENAVLVARLDVLFARAELGRRLGGELAECIPKGTLRLERAYHPLLLLQGLDRRPDQDPRAEVVPFDLTLGEDFDVLVVTGPNTGGKTATLKALGLLVLMAKAAIPLPAGPRSTVPFFDQVFVDIGDEQDLEQSLSTFSGHLERIASILRGVGEESLVLLDELGTGTDPQEGEALGDALLRHLLSVGCRVVATTHLSGLKDLGFELDRVENASLEFDQESLRPLYRLTLGLPGRSNALIIARRHGIPEEVVAAAERRLSSGVGAPAAQVAAHVERSRELVLKKLEGAEEEVRRAEEQRKEWERRLAELEQKQKVLESQKEEEHERELRRIAEKGEAVLASLGTLPANLAPRLEPVRRFLAELPRRSNLVARRHEYVQSLKKDDLVYLPRYREHVRVRKVDRVKSLVTVLYRSLPLEVPFDEISAPDDRAPPRPGA